VDPVSAATSNPPLATAPDPSWRRLARSLAHEIRNPLVSIRTFTELLPEHYADETFRARFSELVGKDVAHIQDVVSRLSTAAARDHFEIEPVDVSGLVERLLSARRERIGRSRLVVLSELEHAAPRALADADALETALAGLLDRALDSLPEHGDLFISTRRIERAGDGRPRLRVLLRHHDPRASGMGGELDPVSHILEYVLAETIVTALGGRLTIDPTQGPETLIVIDLPTP
jgi:nitrogen-specific signal transduction histidine kinase